MEEEDEEEEEEAATEQQRSATFQTFTVTEQSGRCVMADRVQQEAAVGDWRTLALLFAAAASASIFQAVGGRPNHRAGCVSGGVASVGEAARRTAGSWRGESIKLLRIVQWSGVAGPDWNHWSRS